MRHTVVTGIQWQWLWKPHWMPDASLHLQSQQQGEGSRGKCIQRGLSCQNPQASPQSQAPKPVKQQCYLKHFWKILIPGVHTSITEPESKLWGCRHMCGNHSRVWNLRNRTGETKAKEGAWFDHRQRWSVSEARAPHSQPRTPWSSSCSLLTHHSYLLTGPVSRNGPTNHL